MTAERTFTLDEIRRIVGTPVNEGTSARRRVVRRTISGLRVSEYIFAGGRRHTPPVETIEDVWVCGLPRTNVPSRTVDAFVAQALRLQGYILAEDIGL